MTLELAKKAQWPSEAIATSGLRPVPSDKKPDSTLDLLREGYLFLSHRRESLGSDIFSTRLMLHKTLCIHGREAARLLYDPALFIRHGAAPLRIQKTLTGKKGVQSLDDDAHYDRKAMFMAVMTREQLARWGDILRREWQSHLPLWTRADRIVLFNASQALLCRAACLWTGVPLTEGEERLRGRQMGAMVSGFASLGPRHWAARKARRHAERWMEDIIEKVRDNALESASGTPLRHIAWHKDGSGQLLPTRTAAVEVLNLIRPITAIAIYVTFLFAALQAYPECRAALCDGQPDYDEWFVQEVRRYYPFTPFVGALARKGFDWNGYRIPQGQRVLLDVYGMLHDPRLWEQPERFMPERFRNRSHDPYVFIPQGGGEFLAHHRCAGEWLTMETMKIALDFLVRRMTYTVPEQDLRFSLSHIPSLPESGGALSFTTW